MRSKYLLAAAFASVGASCTPVSPVPDNAAENSDAASIVLNGRDISEPITATQLHRPGDTIPASADTDRDDVPRDKDGRPFTHEYLGKVIPAFEGQTADGEAYSSEALLGKWTIIEVWGLWCHDSMRDAPYAAALSTALRQDPDIDFMSVHTPHTKEEADTAFAEYNSVAAYFDEKGYSFLTVVDTDASIRTNLHIRWTPSYLLIAPDGSMQGFRTGLSVADDEPVKDFVRQISEIRGEWMQSEND